MAVSLNSAASITIWIDPTTKAVKVDFVPQMLQPAEYGIVIATFIAHLAAQFSQDNPEVSQDRVITEILRGVEAGITQRDDMVLPQHHTH